MISRSTRIERFIRRGVYREYAEKYLSVEQIDEFSPGEYAWNERKAGYRNCRVMLNLRRISRRIRYSHGQSRVLVRVGM